MNMEKKEEALLPVTRALVELPAASLPEVGDRAELAHDGPPRVPPPHEPLEGGVRVLLIQELRQPRRRRQQQQRERQRQKGGHD